jgi:hypothetical protein
MARCPKNIPKRDQQWDQYFDKKIMVSLSWSHWSHLIREIEEGYERERERDREESIFYALPANKIYLSIISKTAANSGTEILSD